jgi:hypothetical protein
MFNGLKTNQPKYTKKMCDFLQNHGWGDLNDQFAEIKYPTFIIVHPGSVFHQIEQNVASIAIKHI